MKNVIMVTRGLGESFLKVNVENAIVTDMQQHVISKHFNVIPASTTHLATTVRCAFQGIMEIRFMAHPMTASAANVP